MMEPMRTPRGSSSGAARGGGVPRARRGLVRSIGAVAAALLALVAVTAAPTLAATSTVTIPGFSFSPGSVTVHVGDRVTWRNTSGIGHTATADDGSFDTGTIAGGSSGSVTLSNAGTFAYHCSIHPSMQGTVIVLAATATPPATDTADGPVVDGWPQATLVAVLLLGGAAALALAFVGARIRARD